MKKMQYFYILSSVVSVLFLFSSTAYAASSSGGVIVIFPLQNPGQLYLDTPALPDTVATKETVADAQWSYFSWNSFIAMNWPALETKPDKYRGIPDTNSSFAGAANDDLTVWETIKEKREVFNHPNTAGSLTWYSPIDYGTLRLANGVTTTTNQRTFHQNSGTSVSPDGLDETVEVQSESLEAFYPDGLTPNPLLKSKLPVVTPRVWRGQPSALNPVVYEVKLNYDYFNYVVSNGYNVNNSSPTNPVAKAAGNANIHLPYRTSSAKPPTGGNKLSSKFGYRANYVHDYFKAVNVVYNKNKTSSNIKIPVPPPPKEGSVQIKAAWVKLGGSDAKASDYPTWHTSQAQYYQQVGTSGSKKIEASEASLFGLVGMHIIQRIHTSNTKKIGDAGNAEGGTFVFSTWEHSSIFNSPVDGMGGAVEYYYSNYYDGQGNPPAPKPPLIAKGFYPPLDKKAYPIERMYPILPNVAAANTAVHKSIKKVNPNSVWLNYHLVGTQFQAVNVNVSKSDVLKPNFNPNDPTNIGQPIFLSNLAIESNVGLQHFRGQPPQITPIANYSSQIKKTSLGFYHDNTNMAFQGTGYNMGGCMGCHGVAQSKGYAFSFVLLDGYLGAATDTQEHFDQPGANPK